MGNDRHATALTFRRLLVLAGAWSAVPVVLAGQTTATPELMIGAESNPGPGGAATRAALIAPDVAIRHGSAEMTAGAVMGFGTGIRRIRDASATFGVPVARLWSWRGALRADASLAEPLPTDSRWSRAHLQLELSHGNASAGYSFAAGLAVHGTPKFRLVCTGGPRWRLGQRARCAGEGWGRLRDSARRRREQPRDAVRYLCPLRDRLGPGAGTDARIVIRHAPRLFDRRGPFGQRHVRWHGHGRQRGGVLRRRRRHEAVRRIHVDALAQRQRRRDGGRVSAGARRRDRHGGDERRLRRQTRGPRRRAGPAATRRCRDRGAGRHALWRQRHAGVPRVVGFARRAARRPHRLAARSHAARRGGMVARGAGRAGRHLPRRSPHRWPPLDGTAWRPPRRRRVRGQVGVIIVP